MKERQNVRGGRICIEMSGARKGRGCWAGRVRRRWTGEG